MLAESVPGGRNAVEMGLECAIGLIRVPAADRIDDRNMLVIADFIMLIQLGIRHFRARGNQPVEQRNVDRIKDRIAGNFRQHAVKIDVGSDKQCVIIQRLAVDLQRLCQPSDLLVSGKFSGKTDKAGFKEQT